MNVLLWGFICCDVTFYQPAEPVGEAAPILRGEAFGGGEDVGAQADGGCGLSGGAFTGPALFGFGFWLHAFTLHLFNR